MSSTVFPLIGQSSPSIQQALGGNFVGAATSGGGLAATTVVAHTGLGALAPAAAVPIVGGIVAAVGAIAGALMAASAKRAAEAKDENSALNSAVQHVDQGIAQVFQALNSGQIQPQDAISLLGQIKQQYWSIVTPHIQPGRNGCNSGSGIPIMTGVAAGDPVPSPSPYYGCPDSGSFNKSWGASCCAGSTIHQAIANCIYVIQKGGGTANIPKLFPSKYGFAGRAEYNVNYAPSPLASVSGVASGLAGPVADALTGVAQSVGLPSQVGGVKIGTALLLLAGAIVLKKVLF